MSNLTNKKLAKLFTGKDYWHSFDIENEMPSLFMSDGPHGLRVEITTGVGFSPSKEAIVYPSASALGCSFDRKLMYQFGQMLAEDCHLEKVNVLLGPGVNHKRSPLCGRNFEYFSEDPILTSELSSMYIKGLQDDGVGACVKHYAVNSREMSRLVQDSIIDERSLNEIYLRQFERIIKKANPYSIMAAYNKVNGTYCTENSFLLKDTLRNKWKYDGLIVSDWGAVSSPLKAFKNGLNLQMPGPDHGTSSILLDAINSGEIKQEDLIENYNYHKIIHSKIASKKVEYNLKKHYDFAQELAEKTAVLLKNDNVLPINKDESVALIGTFGKSPRYQGTGSSKVNCPDVDCLYDVLKDNGIKFEYAKGYHTHIDESDPILLEQAKLIAKNNDKVIMIMGLPDGKEAEGYDRTSLELPKCQNELIEAVSKVNPNIIVILQCGAPVTMPWLSNVKGVMISYLSGCRGGSALKRLLYGEVSPRGKLAETFPLNLESTPCFRYYHDSMYYSQYRESIFTGYRYYDTYNQPVLFPFGHGLSYTSFEYSNIDIRQDNNTITVSFDLTNTGNYKAAEVYQIYVGIKDSKISRANKELKQFDVVELDIGETKHIETTIDKNDLKYYDISLHDYSLEDGEYIFEIGSSSNDIRLTKTLHIKGNTNPYSTISKEYISLNNGIVEVSDEDFAKILNHDIPIQNKTTKISPDSTVLDLNSTRIGRFINKLISLFVKRKNLNDVSQSMVLEAPIRMMLMGFKKVTWKTVYVVVDYLNGNHLGIITRIIKSLDK